MVYRSRAVRARKQKRKNVKPRYFGKRRYKLGSKGTISILRKTYQLAISAGNTQGVPEITSPPSGSTTMLSLGTAVQIPGGAGTALYNLPFAMSFSLSQLLNHADITAIADKYCIKGAYVRIYPYAQGTSVVDGNTYGTPFVQYITDHDDATPPTMTQLREKMGLKTATFKNQNSYIGIKCRPVPNGDVINQSVSSPAVVYRRAPFLDCGYDTVQHYGIKGALMGIALPGSASGKFTIAFDVSLHVVAKDLQ